MVPGVDPEAVPGSGGDPLSPDTVDGQGLEPLACVSCRARKLKCDRTKPSCKRCVKVSNECVYPESRRKPTVKRRNVKELETRLAQVEDYLKEVTQDGSAGSGGSGKGDDSQSSTKSAANGQSKQTNSVPNSTEEGPGTSSWPGEPQGDGLFEDAQLMGLGINEALPPFEVMEELNTTFFTAQHAHLPIIHPMRFWQAFYGGPLRKPAPALQYAMWALAAQFHPKYTDYSEVFYARARQYVDADEMKGSGEHFITVQHAQAYAIIATYEAKRMLFTRAAMTSAKCIRLTQMMGLDRLDGEQDDLPPTLIPPTSWVEMEERRRTFWAAFAIDSHASISTGWPSLINSSDVTTRLPASEEAFTSGTEEKTPFMEDVFQGATYSGFAGTVVICRLFKAIMHHVHRSKPYDRPSDLMEGPYWVRHRTLDNEVSSTFVFLPEQFRLPANVRDPSALHTNLNLHASVICLHHAAIEKAAKYGLEESIKKNSLSRLKTAAEEIVNIARMTFHMANAFQSPLSALSLYSATTVYVFLAKDKTTQLTSIDRSNLEMLVRAMEAIGRHHQITRAFLQQACLDIERNGLSEIMQLPELSKYRNLFGGAYSNIPLLARSSIGRHTEMSPVLPGKLPLGNPKGKTRPSHLRLKPPYGIPLDAGHQLEAGHNLDGEQSAHFQAMLGAVTRNISVPNVNQMGQNDQHASKRKRTSASPIPASRVDSHPTDLGLANRASFCMTISQEGIPLVPANMSQKHFTNFNIPDRTGSSSSSSPLNRTNGHTETYSGSSNNPSPGQMGLGNTLEENTFDFRPFQDRMMTPLWPPTTEEAIFGQVTEEMVTNALGMDNSESWNGLYNDVWDTHTS